MGKSGVEMSVEVLGSTSNVPAPTEEIRSTFHHFC